MTTTSSLTLLALLAAVASTGCELQPCPKDDTGDNTEETKEGSCTVLKSTKRFNGNDEVMSAEWAPGSTVAVEVILGDLTVIEGTTDTQVSVTARPFVRRAYDVTDEDARQSMEPLELRVGTDADGTVRVRTLRNGGNNTLGADVTVEVPQGFDGALDVFKTNGNIDATVASVSRISLVTEIGDITARFGEIPTDSTGGVIDAQFGDVTLTMPTNATYTLGATADDLVDFGTPPDTCVEEVAADNSKRLTCNDAAVPEFTVTAEGLSGEVTVGYN